MIFCLTLNILTQAGFIASLPYVVKAFVGPTGGFIVDKMINQGMEVGNARKMIFAIGKICHTFFAR